MDKEFQCPNCMKHKKVELQRDIGTSRPVCVSCADEFFARKQHTTEGKRLATGKITQKAYASGKAYENYFSRFEHG